MKLDKYEILFDIKYNLKVRLRRNLTKLKQNE